MEEKIDYGLSSWITGTSAYEAKLYADKANLTTLRYALEREKMYQNRKTVIRIIQARINKLTKSKAAK